jgi:hypothetical protein
MRAAGPRQDQMREDRAMARQRRGGARLPAAPNPRRELAPPPSRRRWRAHPVPTCAAPDGAGLNALGGLDEPSLLNGTG